MSKFEFAITFIIMMLFGYVAVPVIPVILIESGIKLYDFKNLKLKVKIMYFCIQSISFFLLIGGFIGLFLLKFY